MDESLANYFSNSLSRMDESLANYFSKSLSRMDESLANYFLKSIPIKKFKLVIEINQRPRICDNLKLIQIF